MTKARQTIPVIITFTKFNTNSQERQDGAYRSRRKHFEGRNSLGILEVDGIYILILRVCKDDDRSGQRSRYSDWLWAGRYGDGILMGARFYAPVQTGFGAYPATCTMANGPLFRG